MAPEYVGPCDTSVGEKEGRKEGITQTLMQEKSSTGEPL